MHSISRISKVATNRSLCSIQNSRRTSWKLLPPDNLVTCNLNRPNSSWTCIVTTIVEFPLPKVWSANSTNLVNPCWVEIRHPVTLQRKKCRWKLLPASGQLTWLAGKSTCSIADISWNSFFSIVMVVSQSVTLSQLPSINIAKGL